MTSGILCSRGASPRPVEARQRVQATNLQRPAKHISISFHRISPVLVRMTWSSRNASNRNAGRFASFRPKSCSRFFEDKLSVSRSNAPSCPLQCLFFSVSNAFTGFVQSHSHSSVNLRFVPLPIEVRSMPRRLDCRPAVGARSLRVQF